MAKIKRRYFLKWHDDDDVMMMCTGDFMPRGTPNTKVKFFSSYDAAHTWILENWGGNINTPRICSESTASTASTDSVNPSHYQQHPALKAANLQVRDITSHMNFNLGNVVKYVLRHEYKNGVTDLKKAAEYLQYEIARLEESGSK